MSCLFLYSYNKNNFYPLQTNKLDVKEENFTGLISENSHVLVSLDSTDSSVSVFLEKGNSLWSSSSSPPMRFI